jgi:membrane protein implicated in regulation of membrane protease activity
VRAFLALVGGAAVSIVGLLLALASDLDLLGVSLIAIGAVLAALGRRESAVRREEG